MAILHIQRHRNIRRCASRFSWSYSATFHRSIKRSHHWRLSHNQLAIVEQISHLSATELTSRSKQIFLPPLNFFFRNASTFVFVCFLKALSSLSLHHLRQTAVSNLCGRTSFLLSQHEIFLSVVERCTRAQLWTTVKFYKRKHTARSSRQNAVSRYSYQYRFWDFEREIPVHFWSTGTGKQAALCCERTIRLLYLHEHIVVGFNSSCYNIPLVKAHLLEYLLLFGFVKTG